MAPNFTLPAWNGAMASLGFSTDSVLTRSVFYLGTDRRLYQTSSINFVWTPRDNRSSDFWPRADDANGDFTTTYNVASSSVRIYYDVGGALTEVKQTTDGEWQPAAALAATNITGAVVAPPPGNATEEAPPAADPGLSAASKAGIGVGVTLGVLAVVGGLAAVCVLRRQRRREQADEAAGLAAAAERDHEERPQDPEQQRYRDGVSSGHPSPFGTPGHPSPYGTPSPPYDAYTADGKAAAEAYASQELEAKPRAVYEMDEQQPRHELQ